MKFEDFYGGTIKIASDNGVNLHIWTDNGLREWFVTPEEKNMAPKELAAKILNIWVGSTAGELSYRCSQCDTVMKKSEVAGWPLFAGIACRTHWQTAKKKAQDEISKGHVCRRCGSPYSECCC